MFVEKGIQGLLPLNFRFTSLSKLMLLKQKSIPFCSPAPNEEIYLHAGRRSIDTG